MTDQVRGFILSAIAALAGWSGITSVGLLIQVSSLQATTDTLEKNVEANTARDERLEDKIYGELKLLREAVEKANGRQ